MLQHRVTPLSSLEVDEYMLALSQEFRGSIRDSPFYLKEKICKKGNSFLMLLILMCFFCHHEMSGECSSYFCHDPVPF